MAVPPSAGLEVDAPAAVRRAGRMADKWIVPAGVDLADVGPLLELFSVEQSARGLAPSPQPLRRNVFLGRDRGTPSSSSIARRARYQHYARNGHEEWRPNEVARDFAEVVGAHVLAGSPDDVLAQIQQIAATLPVDPLILRAGWPGMDPDWFVAYLDDLGRPLVPGIAEISPSAAPPGRA